MIHSRGAGCGSGPVGYLLGEDRKREQATVLRGDPEQTIQLIDTLKYAQKYTSGVLSFDEGDDLTDKQINTVMDLYTKAFTEGLDGDQFNILWVEHRDKGRLELNFVIPNVELQSGKRLQPYYDRADRTRLNAVNEVVRVMYDLADPNDPARRRTLTTSKNLPRDTKKAAETINEALSSMVAEGLITSRDDVVKVLKEGGFELARETPNSISIKSPEGGRNIRLKGSIYERNFKPSEQTAEEIERNSRAYAASANERLATARETYLKASEIKRAANNKRYPRAASENKGSSTLQELHDANTVRVSVNQRSSELHSDLQVHSVQDSSELDGLREVSPQPRRKTNILPDRHIENGVNTNEQPDGNNQDIDASSGGNADLLRAISIKFRAALQRVGAAFDKLSQFSRGHAQQAEKADNERQRTMQNMQTLRSGRDNSNSKGLQP